jgi:hypothetical protein
MLKHLVAILALLALTHVVEAKCQPTKVETDINQIRLDDEQSVERVLGKIDALPIGANDKGSPKSDTPELIVYNRDKTEQAILTYYPGGSPGSFEVIEVRPVARADLVGKTLDVAHFSTERGIRLGVSPKFVMTLLGDCYSKEVSKAGETTIEYALEDSAMRHPFLKRANLPNYFGRYHFRDGKLHAFEIGSDYP